jgi:hypothetical protein
VSERKEPAQLLGEALRDMAVLVAVFLPLDMYIQHELDLFHCAVASVIFGVFMWWGIILEGKDEYW